MRPPGRRNARQAPGVSVKTRQRSQHHTPSATRTFCVVVTKARLVDVVFKTGVTRRECELLVASLRGIGCEARCEPARATDVPGVTRSP